MTPFLFLDSETVNRPGRGEACWIGATTAKGGLREIEFPGSFKVIFDWLSSRPARYCTFNMDFDARAVCHPEWVPYRVIEGLGLFGRAKWGPYRFRFIAGKFFEVRHRDGRSFILFDLQQFYGTSLDKATEKYVPDLSKLEIPRSWYLEMDACLRDFRRARLLAYARRDVTGGAALLDILLRSLAAIGIRPKRLSSCASIARSRYGKLMEGAKAPDYVNGLFERGFFGGRIEARTLGVVRRVKLWDVNSAYPSVIARLKNPSTGEHTVTRDGWRYSAADYGLYHVTAHVPLSMAFGPLAVRERGRVFYPVGVVRTWCCAPAIEALRSAGIRFQVGYAYEIHDCDPSPILPDIEAMYYKRKASDAGLAIKLTLNSIYGLWAEASNYLAEDPDGAREVMGRRVASRSSYGRLTNFALASHITESCRMKLWDVMRRHPAAVHFAATDGLLLDEKVDLPTGGGLGEWSLKGAYGKGVILGCGRYLLQGDKEEYHLRGFPVRRELFDKLKSCKRAYCLVSQLDTPSLRQWASSFSADDFNVLAPRWKRLEVTDEKRYWPKTLPRIKDYFRGSVSSEPFILGSPKALAESRLLGV